MSIERGSEHDFLIAEYTLGLLDPHENAGVNQLLSEDSQAVATALKWEALFLSLTDELEPVSPPPHLLQRIQATLGHEITLIKRPKKWPRALKKIWSLTLGGVWFWRLVSVVLAFTTVTYALKPNHALIKPNPAVINAPPPTHVAILQAPGQTSTPGWIFTLNDKHDLVMDPKVHIDVPANSAVELWTHNPQDRTPRSLGIVPANQPVVIPAAKLGDITSDQFFEMTLEQTGGSPTGNPSGPILFLGRMVVLQTKPSQAGGTASTTPATTSGGNTAPATPSASPDSAAAPANGSGNQTNGK